MTFHAGFSAADTLTFSNLVATYSQTYENFDAAQMIDGSFASINGWGIWRGEGIADPTLSETALLILAAPLAPGAYSFKFTLYQYHGNPGHSLGDFGLGYDTSLAPDLSNTQTPLVITGASGLNEQLSLFRR